MTGSPSHRDHHPYFSAHVEMGRWSYAALSSDLGPIDASLRPCENAMADGALLAPTDKQCKEGISP